MTATVAFPTWRAAWATLDGTPPLLAKVDILLHRRVRGNHLLPTLDAASTSRLSVGIEALRRWTDGQPPAELSARPSIARNLYSAIAPALHAAAWPRWILLERAFLDGSAAGDLLFSALAIRTLCEEAQRLLSLDLNAEQIEALAASDNAMDHARFDLFLKMARASLDKPSDPLDANFTALPHLEWAAATRPQLQSAKQALNDYVHPNYGSHIAALFPESAVAARILLEGIVAAYDSFFALSWSELPLAGRSVPLSITPFKTWSGTVRRFTKKVLPEIKKQTLSDIEAGRVDSEVQEVFNAPSVVSWLSNKHADARTLLNDSKIAALVESLRLPGETAGRDKSDHQSTQYRLWDAASERDVLSLAMARRAEQILTEAFPDGEPERSKQARWLHFVSLALQLAIALDDLKAAAFKAQLVRQIVSGNPLGILLCVRSLIEYKAVANWLVNRLALQWAEISRRVKPDADLPTQAAQIEQAIAKFLTGTQGSKENELPWTTREVHGRRAIHLSLLDVVDKAFGSNDRFKKIYDIASAAIHGRSYRGLDLLAQNNDGLLNLISLAVLVLERLCDPNERKDLIAQAFVLNTNIEHAAVRGGTAAAASEVQVKGAFGHFEGKLKSGRDYTGEGSRELPFRLRSHLQFHQASQILLQQMNVEWTHRQLKKGADGSFCDCYQAGEREWWFMLPENSPL